MDLENIQNIDLHLNEQSSNLKENKTDYETSDNSSEMKMDNEKEINNKQNDNIITQIKQQSLDEVQLNKQAQNYIKIHQSNPLLQHGSNDSLHSNLSTIYSIDDYLSTKTPSQDFTTIQVKSNQQQINQQEQYNIKDQNLDIKNERKVLIRHKSDQQNSPKKLQPTFSTLSHLIELENKVINTIKRRNTMKSNNKSEFSLKSEQTEQSDKSGSSDKTKTASGSGATTRSRQTSQTQLSSYTKSSGQSNYIKSSGQSNYSKSSGQTPSFSTQTSFYSQIESSLHSTQSPDSYSSIFSLNDIRGPELYQQTTQQSQSEQINSNSYSLQQHKHLSKNSLLVKSSTYQQLDEIDQFQNNSYPLQQNIQQSLINNENINLDLKEFNSQSNEEFQQLQQQFHISFNQTPQSQEIPQLSSTPHELTNRLNILNIKDQLAEFAKKISSNILQEIQQSSNQQNEENEQINLLNQIISPENIQQTKTISTKSRKESIITNEQSEKSNKSKNYKESYISDSTYITKASPRSRQTSRSKQSSFTYSSGQTRTPSLSTQTSQLSSLLSSMYSTNYSPSSFSNVSQSNSLCQQISHQNSQISHNSSNDDTITTQKSQNLTKITDADQSTEQYEKEKDNNQINPNNFQPIKFQNFRTGSKKLQKFYEPSSSLLQNLITLQQEKSAQNSYSPLVQQALFQDNENIEQNLEIKDNNKNQDKTNLDQKDLDKEIANELHTISNNNYQQIQQYHNQQMPKSYIKHPLPIIQPIPLPLPQPENENNGRLKPLKIRGFAEQFVQQMNLNKLEDADEENNYNKQQEEEKKEQIIHQFSDQIELNQSNEQKKQIQSNELYKRNQSIRKKQQLIKNYSQALLQTQKKSQFVLYEKKDQIEINQNSQIYLNSNEFQKEESIEMQNENIDHQNIDKQQNHQLQIIQEENKINSQQNIIQQEINNMFTTNKDINNNDIDINKDQLNINQSLVNSTSLSELGYKHTNISQSLKFLTQHTKSDINHSNINKQFDSSQDSNSLQQNKVQEANSVQQSELENQKMKNLQSNRQASNETNIENDNFQPIQSENSQQISAQQQLKYSQSIYDFQFQEQSEPNVPQSTNKNKNDQINLIDQNSNEKQNLPIPQITENQSKISLYSSESSLSSNLLLQNESNSQLLSTEAISQQQQLEMKLQSKQQIQNISSSHFQQNLNDPYLQTSSFQTPNNIYSSISQCYQPLIHSFNPSYNQFQQLSPYVDFSPQSQFSQQQQQQIQQLELQQKHIQQFQQQTIQQQPQQQPQNYQQQYSQQPLFPFKSQIDNSSYPLFPTPSLNIQHPINQNLPLSSLTNTIPQTNQNLSQQQCIMVPLLNDPQMQVQQIIQFQQIPQQFNNQQQQNNQENLLHVDPTYPPNVNFIPYSQIQHLSTSYPDQSNTQYLSDYHQNLQFIDQMNYQYEMMLQNQQQFNFNQSIDSKEMFNDENQRLQLNQINQSNQNYKQLQNQITQHTNKKVERCYYCANLGHYFSQCPYHALQQATTPEERINAQRSIQDMLIISSGLTQKRKSNINHQNNNQPSELYEQNNSTFLINSYNIFNSDICHRCGQPGHSQKDCKSDDKRICFKCGQIGHIVKECPIKNKKKKSTNQ